MPVIQSAQSVWVELLHHGESRGCALCFLFEPIESNVNWLWLVLAQVSYADTAQLSGITRLGKKLFGSVLECLPDALKPSQLEWNQRGDLIRLREGKEGSKKLSAEEGGGALMVQMRVGKKTDCSDWIGGKMVDKSDGSVTALPLGYRRRPLWFGS